MAKLLRVCMRPRHATRLKGPYPLIVEASTPRSSVHPKVLGHVQDHKDGHKACNAYQDVHQPPAEELQRPTDALSNAQIWFGHTRRLRGTSHLGHVMGPRCSALTLGTLPCILAALLADRRPVRLCALLIDRMRTEQSTSERRFRFAHPAPPGTALSAVRSPGYLPNQLECARPIFSRPKRRSARTTRSIRFGSSANSPQRAS